MSDFFFLIPIALGLGLIGLGAFMWALKDHQYDDIEGAAARILIEDDTPVPDIAAPATAPEPATRPGRGE